MPNLSIFLSKAKKINKIDKKKINFNLKAILITKFLEILNQIRTDGNGRPCYRIAVYEVIVDYALYCLVWPKKGK